MTQHQIWATAVVVWLVGLFMAWCLGCATSNRHDRAGRSGLTGQLARVRLELATALDELGDLEHARLRWEAHRSPAPPPAAVHVHVTAPLPWTPHQLPHQPLMPLDTPRSLDAMPVLPAEEVQS